MFLSFMAKREFVLFGGLLFQEEGLKKVCCLVFGMAISLKTKTTHGTNKQIFYKIFKKAEEIDEAAIVKLLKEAITIDNCLPKITKPNQIA